jgi:hypothetical protein
LPEPYRAAVYYAPEPDDPLWAAGCAWLGRNPETGADRTQPLEDFTVHTADARRYGFHATLKAPMALRRGLKAFLRDVEIIASATPAFDLPALAVTSLNGFLALCCTAPSPELDRLAGDCVMVLDRHRIAEDEAAQARRAQGLTPRQAAHVALWGYPYVLEDFLFHMTLTARLSPNPYAEAAEALFAPALAQSRRVTNIAIFVEDTPGAPFRLSHRFSLAPHAPIFQDGVNPSMQFRA